MEVRYFGMYHSLHYTIQHPIPCNCILQGWLLVAITVFDSTGIIFCAFSFSYISTENDLHFNSLTLYYECMDYMYACTQ